MHIISLILRYIKKDGNLSKQQKHKAGNNKVYKQTNERQRTGKIKATEGHENILGERL